MKLFLLSLLFTASCLCAETDTNLYDRIFFFQPPRGDLREPLSSEEKNKKLMDFFHEYFGVQWPAGSELVQDDSERSTHIYVRNTHQQLAKIETGIAKWDALAILRYPLEIALIAFHKEDIEYLQTSGALTAEGLLKLHKRGRSKPLSKAFLLTKVGSIKRRPNTPSSRVCQSQESRSYGRRKQSLWAEAGLMMSGSAMSLSR